MVDLMFEILLPGAKVSRLESNSDPMLFMFEVLIRTMASFIVDENGEFIVAGRF